MKFVISILFATIFNSCSGYYNDEHLLHVQTFTGQVGSGNFSYYRLMLEGCVIVQLETMTGDADLYVSSSSLKPTWESYDLKSTTCGIDEVVIYPSQVRPIGIGVYGYILDELNTFQLGVYIDPKYIEPYPESDNAEKYRSLTDEKLTPLPPGNMEEEVEGESLLWTIFVGFLKILFDVLL
uniref:UPF0669 protein v1g209471-like n=1 Tax=Styela clava TaxID=7725 RepID=UPI00193A2C8D|nr:UPF0669 protein v1g209471-like [Styela clava]